MLSEDYWVVKYQIGGKKHLQHICANYKQYTVEKIKKIFNELNPEWEILKVYPIEKLEFKQPNRG
jgi:hypothetical protein|tara:strand:+ start:1208 stop:1402 length:195 start_codon:yes stop_codon:yes gene_type:complete